MGRIPLDIDGLEKVLASREVPFVRERFRLPARPGISAAAGLGASAAAAFLLAAGRPGAAFLAAVLGTAVLLLDAFGFAPLDWAGPTRRASVLVAPGDPATAPEKSLFVACPLVCGRRAAGAAPGSAGLSDHLYRAGLLLSLALIVLAGGSALLLPSLPPFASAAAGALLAAAGAAQWPRRGEPAGVPNLAVLGAVRLASAAAGGGARPHVLFYRGDGGEVKFFLARYRGPLFRGRGVFAFFPAGDEGSPEVGVREGLFLPYGVDPALLASVRAAASSAGVPAPEPRILRGKTPGLFAMARGFRCVTLLRRPSPPSASPVLPDGAALAWLAAVAEELAPDRKAGL